MMTRPVIVTGVNPPVVVKAVTDTFHPKNFPLHIKPTLDGEEPELKVITDYDSVFARA